MRETNILKAKQETKKLLNIPVSMCKITSLPGFLSHPFSKTSFVVIQNNNNNEIINIEESRENERKWKEYLENIIDKERTSLINIYMMLNDVYRLFWVYRIKPFLSKKDFSEFLSDAWVSSENPNQDVNVSITQSINMFKSSTPEHLMAEEDYEKFKKIPNKIKLYRGVSSGRNPYGLSWTASINKAEWFKNRFKNGGFILTLEVSKEDILAYLNTRGEDEYVVNTNKYKNFINNQLKEMNFYKAAVEETV